MSCSLDLLEGDIEGSIERVIKRDTRSLDYSSNGIGNVVEIWEHLGVVLAASLHRKAYADDLQEYD